MRTGQDLAGLDFRESMRDAQKGLLIKNQVHNYLFDATFPDFEVKFIGHQMARDPDDWFHPSTHPLWPEQALFNYLRHPDKMPREQMLYMNTLSVTVGTALHGFIEMCLKDLGLRPDALNVCTTCPPGNTCTEPGVVDQETGARGHMDGLLDLSSLAVPGPEFLSPILEFKSSNERTLAKIDDLDVVAYAKKWPEYYAQNQEYMRLSGRRVVIVFIMALGYPWVMREIHVPYDPVFADGIRRKYLRVREAVAADAPLSCCQHKGCVCASLCEGLGDRMIKANEGPRQKPRSFLLDL